MAGVQRHLDLLAFNLSAQSRAAETAYDENVHHHGMLAMPPAHQNFEQIQAYARDLLLRQIIGDALNLSLTALNNGHLFLALVKEKEAHGELSEEAQRAAQQAQNTFVQAPLDQKFNRLEESYKVMCPLEDTITSLGLMMQCLLQQQGEVRAAQLDEQGELPLELQVPRGALVPGQRPFAEDRLEARLKVFRTVGEKIALSDAELAQVLITAGAFADQFFMSVARYARDHDGNA